MKLLLLRGVLCCGLLAPMIALGFPPAAPPPPLASRAAAAQPQSAVPRPPSSPRNTQHRRPRSGLRAFGPGAGGFNFVRATPPPAYAPITTPKDALRRLAFILAGTIRQFASGFTNGYLLALIWGALRGPSLVVANRGLAWGQDFGVVSALFFSGALNQLAELALALRFPTTKKHQTGSNKEDGKDSGAADAGSDLKRRRKATILWSSVVRNMLLAAYFGRAGTLATVVRLAALYGGLTYLLVGRTLKRHEKMGGMFGGGMPGSMGGMGGMGGMPGMGGMGGMGGAPSSQDAMKQMLIQMMAANGQMPYPPGAGAGSPPTPSPNRGPSTGGRGFGQTPSSARSTPPSSASRSDAKKKRDTAIDVEFEKIVDASEDSEGE